MVYHIPSFSPGNLLTLLFSQSSRSWNLIQFSRSSQWQISETDLGSQTIVLFIDIHSPPIFTNAQLLFLGHLLHSSIMSFVSERSGGSEYEWPCEGFGVSTTSLQHERRATKTSQKGNWGPSAPDKCLATGKSPGTGRTGSESGHTRDDCEHEREAEEEERMAIEVSPVESA